MKTLFTFSFLFSTFISFSQFINGVGGDFGFRIQTAQTKNNSITHQWVNASSYFFGVFVRKDLIEERLNVSAGVSLVFEQQLLEFDNQYLYTLPGFNTQSKSLMVANFVMDNRQLGIPIKLSYELFEGWYDLYPIIWFPAIGIHTGLNAQYKLSRNNVNTNFYSDSIDYNITSTLTNAVSDYFQNRIYSFALQGQIGLDFYRKLENCDAGISLNLNGPIFSQYDWSLNMKEQWGVDFRFYYMYKIPWY